MNSPSVVEAVAQLDENLARVDVMRAAEGEAVVEQHAAVGDVEGLHNGGESLTKTPAKREIKCGVRLEMVARRNLRGATVGEARGVGYVCVCRNMPRQRELAAEVKRVALIVVEKTAAAAKGEICEATVDAAAAESQLIGIGQIKLAAVANARRAQGELPAVDASALDSDRDENFG